MSTTTKTTPTISSDDSSLFEIDQDIIDWLLEGDVSIQYQVYRDLLNQERHDLQQRIAFEGWGKQYLDAYDSTIGHWGNGFYQPKWISSHYTLLDLRHLCIDNDSTIDVIKNTIEKILKEEKSEIDGGVDCHNHTTGNNSSKYNSDICVNEQMDDGGFNCRSNRGKPKSSSVHTTISILEGFAEYTKQQQQQRYDTYRIKEIQKASKEGWEFLLRHQLYLSVHKNPGHVINERFLKFPFPTRWYYDILRALDYWQYAELPWDDRLQSSIDVLLSKQRPDGKWNLNSKYTGQVHFDMEKAGKKQPSRWNTLRALRVLKHYHNVTKQQQQNLVAKTTKRKDLSSNDTMNASAPIPARRGRKRKAA